jgi:hypothetical protein
MKTFFKQLLCKHIGINTVTEMNTGNGIIIAKSRIYCQECNKSFPQHPNADCCYVKHIHAGLLHEQFIQMYRGAKQQ